MVHKTKVPLHQLKIESSFKSIIFIEKFEGNLFTDELMKETQNILSIIENVRAELTSVGYGNS